MSIYTQSNITFQQQANMADRTTRSKGPAALSSGLVHSRQKKPKVAQAVPQADVGTSSSTASANGTTIKIGTLSLNLRPSANVNGNVITTSTDVGKDQATEAQSTLNIMSSSSSNVIPRPSVGGKSMQYLTRPEKDSANDDSNPGSSDDEDDINQDTLEDEEPDVLSGDPLGLFPGDDHFGDAANGGQGGVDDSGQSENDQMALDANDVQGGVDDSGQGSTGDSGQGSTGDSGQGSTGDSDQGGMGARVLHSGTNPGRGQGGRTSVRHRMKTKKQGMENLTVNAIKRLARRGGVTRMSKLIVEPVRESMQLFLLMLAKYSIIFMEQDKKTTIRLPHVLQALKKMNRIHYT
jgi:histone H4